MPLLIARQYKTRYVLLDLQFKVLVCYHHISKFVPRFDFFDWQSKASGFQG